MMIKGASEEAVHGRWEMKNLPRGIHEYTVYIFSQSTFQVLSERLYVLC